MVERYQKRIEASRYLTAKYRSKFFAKGSKFDNVYNLAKNRSLFKFLSTSRYEKITVKLPIILTVAYFYEHLPHLLPK